MRCLTVMIRDSTRVLDDLGRFLDLDAARETDSLFSVLVGSLQLVVLERAAGLWEYDVQAIGRSRSSPDRVDILEPARSDNPTLDHISDQLLQLESGYGRLHSNEALTFGYPDHYHFFRTTSAL